MKRLLGLSLAALLVQVGAASAAELDLSTENANGFLNGAFFQQFDPQSTGTGVIDSFVQISAGGNTTPEHAYNTTVNGTLDNGSAANFNHALLLTAVPIVNVGGVEYREFILDLNQNSGSDNEFLTLDEIQIFQSSVANPSVETFGADCILDIPSSNLVYRMDTACVGGVSSGNVALTNYALNSGSGSGDIRMLVLNSLFTGTGEYVYLYSKFGGDEFDETEYGANDGFEEWAVRTPTSGPPPPVIPEPGSLILLGTGLLVGARRLRQRLNRG